MLAEVAELFERLLRELPAGAGTLNVRPVCRSSSPLWRDRRRVEPYQPRGCPFWVHGDDAEVYSFSFGVRSQWEFPHERRYRKGEKDILTEIEEMSRAVIAGRCKERRGWFSLNGSISVGDYTYKITNLPMLPIPPFWTRSYAPYARN
jgi:hypothetical protein